MTKTLTMLLVLVSTSALKAQDANPIADSELAAAARNANTILTSYGVTRKNTPIRALVTPHLLDVKSPKFRILFVVGPGASSQTRKTMLEELVAFRVIADHAARPKRDFECGIVPSPFPDGVPDQKVTFPPSGTAYSDQKQPEAIYLWRWIGMLAPDLVVVVEDENREDWNFTTQVDANSLVGALIRNSVADVGTIAAVHASVPKGKGCLWPFLQTTRDAGKYAAGTAKPELIRRRSRTPITIAEELSKVYGHKLPSVAYIPSLALIGRMRLGELTGNKQHLQDVVRIVEPYVDGSKSSLGRRTSGSTLSGHLVFGELADRTQDDRYITAVRAAANLGFDDGGMPKESMPFHHEMSDAVFMGTPILIQSGRLTGENKYFDMALRHLRFMLDLNLRKDGLHQNSPLDPAGTAWGRGNGFPALGLALSLSDLPKASPHRAEILKQYRSHMVAMIKHQDEMGMWHQVVDHPESYREFTVTCMTTFAIARGLRNGWLDRKTFEPIVRRAWEAIKSRIGPNGRLVDVCTGTGKQKSFRDYLDRKAILGKDDRGGAMALMVSTELEFAAREKVLSLP